jgi:ketosteroid isomerase-like protein
MERSDWIRQLFQSIDARDTEAFSSFLSDDVLFRFGNAEPVNGKAAAKAVVGGFFDSIKGLHHNLIDIWDQQDAVICHGTVIYTRHDSSMLSIPFANIFRIETDLIKEYLIYADISELYKDA